jgi:hypothetical protein
MVRLGRFLNRTRWSASLAVGLIILSAVVLFGLLGPLFVDVEHALVASTPPSLSPAR